MKLKNIIAFCCLFTLSITYFVNAFIIEIERDVPKNLVTSAPNLITVNLYTSNTATVPIATQDFDRSQGEWAADLDFSTFTATVSNIVRFKVNFTNTGSLEKGELWYETLFDGTGYGGRTLLESEAWSLYTESLSIGDSYGGGIIFWLDASGKHGLIAATSDQSTNMRWYAGTNGYTRANGDGPYSGEMNTSIIISAQVAIGDDGSTYAARICNELQITDGGKTYGDWYLPSKYELNQMYVNKDIIGGFASSYYWSSSEFAHLYAWAQNFNNGHQDNNNKVNTHYVRAVRAF